MKILNFRFDVDTHRCMREGVPNLLDLSQSVGCQFTFFVNMGRAVSLAEVLARKRRRPANDLTDLNISKFSPLKKLGVKGYIVAAILNPKVGFGSIDVIKRLVDEGHEYGLHGGFNHATWARNAPFWDYNTIKHELESTLKRISQYGVPQPKSFASPGFAGSPIVNQVLNDLGFDYVSDTYSKTGHNNGEGISPSENQDSIDNLNVNITNGNGIAFIENLRSMGKSDTEIIEIFKEKLSTVKNHAIVYEHPGYAGIFELDLLKKLIQVSSDAGFKIGTSKAIYEDSVTLS